MLSILIVCRQVDEVLVRAINSVEKLSPQIIVDVSSDSKIPLGIRKNRLISIAFYDWLLVLDTDEVVSPELIREIKEIIKDSDTNFSGYEITYQNYIFGKPVFFGGEKYSRNQLFRKSHGVFTSVPIHEHPIIKGKIGKLNGVIHHYSYRNLSSTLFKFTKYAWQMAGEKQKAGERVSVKKLFMYGPHMVWARVIKDEGWRDGWQGIVLALCFGYMETLLYWFLGIRNIAAKLSL